MPIRLLTPFVMLVLLACGAVSVVNDTGFTVATEPVTNDPDDPAIWVHPTDPSKSLILGTNKVRAPEGGLWVYGLDGKTKQVIKNLDRPNNVDVAHGLPLGGKRVDIAVVTERLKQRLLVYGIDAATGELADIGSGGGIAVFAGEQGEAAAPMGVALYRRPKDGAIFAIVGRKTGPAKGYLWQYRLTDDGAGKVKGEKVREFGHFSGSGEIEAIGVDHELGYVYFADEGFGIRKWHADPDHPQAGTELAVLGREGFRGDREGIAVYARKDGTGYIVCADQLEGSSEFRIYRREGAPGNPHDHSEVLKVVRGGADSTDGLEVLSTPLGSRFPNGLLVAMNSASKNFLLFDWRDVAGAGEVKLHTTR